MKVVPPIPQVVNEAKPESKVLSHPQASSRYIEVPPPPSLQGQQGNL